MIYRLKFETKLLAQKDFEFRNCITEQNNKNQEINHASIKKGEFYVSCADFVDKNGTKVDLDFLVIKDGDNLKTIQAVVHSLDGKKRKYHLEG